MAVHVHPGTMPGSVTPICNTCGISLCWDVSDQDYAAAKDFWDKWVCEDCNGGTPRSLKAWQLAYAVPSHPEISKMDEFRDELMKLSVENPVAYELFLEQAADHLRQVINRRTAMINQLREVTGLNDWERSFVDSMRIRSVGAEKGVPGYGLLTLSKKQRDCLTTLHEKHIIQPKGQA